LLGSRLAVARFAAVGLVLLIGGGLAASTAGGTALALPIPQTTFAQQPFTGASAGDGFVKPLAPGAANVACLTAGTDTSTTPIPGCGGVPDADGSGALRLTDTGLGEAGGVGSTISVPISQGLDATFDSYQHGGTGADGMTFFLAATDPINPEVPTELGQFGGSLGYSDQSGFDGLADGYLGIGLDAYGNFPYPSFGSPGCAPQLQSPNTISVRGPGNGAAGYCVVDEHVVSNGALRSGDSARSAANVVPVEVIVNPSGNPTAALVSGVLVPPKSYAVVVTSIGSGGTPDVLIGALPSTLNGEIPAGLYDSAWIDPSTGYPYKLTFGWTGGTGGEGDNHEVTNFTATTLLGASPVLTQTTTGAGTVAPGAASTVDIQASVSTTGGNEASPVVATVVFPPGFTPDDASDASWSCVITGQTERCAYAPASAIAPGTPLPALSMPYLASTTVGTSTIATSLSSLDAAAVSGSLHVTVAKQATSVTGSATQQPGVSTTSTIFGASVISLPGGSPSTPTGGVTFSSASTASVFCTATLSSGSGSCTGSLPLGTPASDIVLTYLGDSTHTASSGSVAAISIITTPVTTFSATATPASATTEILEFSGLPAAASGSVTFTSTGGTILCTAVVPATSCTTGTLTAGSYSVTASYSGDPTYSAASATTSFTVVAPLAFKTLPFTGSSIVVATVVSLSLALVIGGLLFLFIARRRRA
jgi:Bacterial Ig-like domain (group 3)/Bacterial lectin